MTDTQSSRTSALYALGAIGVAMVCGLFFFRLMSRPRGDVIPAMLAKDPGSRFSVEDKRELLKLSHQALGLMENESWRAALKVLAKIQDKFPEDPFAVRNAAIAVSQDIKLPGQMTPVDIQPEQAIVAAERIVKSAPNDPISHILAARIAAKMGDGQLALARYERAVAVDPRSAVGWYELFDTLRGANWETPDSPEQLQKKQKAALLHVAEIQPHNLRATLDLLDVMLATRDVRIIDVLKSLAPQMPLVLRMFQEKIGNDQLGKLYETAVQDVSRAVQGNTQQDWATISMRIPPIINLMRSLDPVYHDMTRLKPNSLDFLQTQFKSAAIRSIDTDSPDSHPAIRVKFSPAPDQLPVTESPLDLKFADYNLDNRPDLWILIAGKLRIFGTQKDSKAWKQLSELPVPEGFTQFLVQDLDWDDQQTGAPKPQPETVEKVASVIDTEVCQQADSDLVIYGPGGIRIWKNEGAADGAARKWIAIEKSGLEGVTDVTTVALTDFDHEGDLDLVVGTSTGLRLWSNREKFTFKDISAQCTLPTNFAIRQVIPVDFDRDVDVDLLVFGEGDAPVTSGILLNRLHGVLEWRTFGQQDLKDVPDKMRGGLLIDADRNVSWDLIGLGPKAPVLALTQTHSPGRTIDLRIDSLPDLFGGGISSTDYDNDGFLDLVSWDGRQLKLLRGGMSGKFLSQADVIPAEMDAAIQDCLSADLDHDGDLELVVRTTEGVQILKNDGGNQNHWLNVRLRARRIVESTPSPQMAMRRVNHQGVGSMLEINAGGYYLPQVVTADTTHFGLGQRKGADLLRVIWTNGVPQSILDAKSEREICELQAPKGSCPFAYTWDGERFTFFTDLLWNAPLGLQFAEGVLAPARQWEYLKVPGNRMVPKGNKYQLQITEELWEATYFDQIELLAVDHPADVEVYTNEKVGPPSIAEFKIHTVKDPRSMTAAHDQVGRDVLSEIAAEDGEFTKSYERVLRQGLTTEHWLELDLGAFDLTSTGGSGVPSTSEQPADAPRSNALTLFLTGWMYPTETSISVGVSQNPDARQARPPALWVPDAKGNWREARPFMGFPGGKTKTIAIDLTGIFPSADHRLRIVTNMQFHWDHAFFTVGETPVEVQTHPLRLESADLHYRGLSRHYWKTGNGPDQYDYSSVLSGPEWPPMQGMFTRYGDVRELLTKSDDLLAIIGAGDEITMTFSLPEVPLPEGWKRDFILHNVGWDKDADLNTVYGQTVEPLPFNAMTSYPYPAHEGPPATAEYRAYLQKYQTRVQDYSEFWRRIRKGRREKSTTDLEE